MSLAARLTIDLNAVEHNLNVARQHCKSSKIMAVVKADAYGHGLERVAANLAAADGFAVSSVEEGVQLRRVHAHHPITVLKGFSDDQELETVIQQALTPVIHYTYQLTLLNRLTRTFDARDPAHPDLWLKLNTGMNRLGFPVCELESVYQQLNKILSGASVGLMTHLASADEENGIQTDVQLRCFEEMASPYANPKSVANSAALLTQPRSYYDWVRPGLMLYGASPVQNRTASSFGLKPAMTFAATLIAIQRCQKGQAIGYNGTWVCPENMDVGIVSAGYGDGYPRHISESTPVLLHDRRTEIVGRVSMDMLAIDLRGLNAKVGDEVVLWGRGLPIDEVARCAGTISYELMCKLTARVSRRYIQ